MVFLTLAFSAYAILWLETSNFAFLLMGVAFLAFYILGTILSKIATQQQQAGVQS
jgi:hypothetical protein